MADKNYLTIGKEASDEFVERKSRFMGFIKPVTTEEEALTFIREKQKKYWDATHNVYAYVLEGGNLCRFSYMLYTLDTSLLASGRKGDEIWRMN